MALKQFIAKIKQYNSGPIPVVDYLLPYIPDTKEVKIADIGSGPFSRTGQLIEGKDVKVYPMDQSNFDYFWERYKTKPLFPIEAQDMENLTYEDNSFDIVHCVNALDHTGDALKAVKEMIRVCKGWVYIDCNLIQKSNRGHNHHWDMLEDGTMTNGKDSFNLKDLGFQIKFIDNGGERQYNQVIATLCLAS